MTTNILEPFVVTDNHIYDQLQKLKRYVRFVAELPITCEVQRQNSIEIIHRIENFNKPLPFKNWSVCIDILDFVVQCRVRKGVFWRKWTLALQNYGLEIKAETCHSEFNNEHFGDDYEFCGFVSNEAKYTHLEQDIDDFVNDALQYTKYMNIDLKELEIDIDLD